MTGSWRCFPTSDAALRASIEMQQGFAADLDDPSLDVRIGINAGEPIEEGSELYGLAVNLARRFCDGTDPSTIMTAESIRPMTTGSFAFTPLGDRLFKGVSAAVPVCLLEWETE